MKVMTMLSGGAEQFRKRKKDQAGPFHYYYCTTSSHKIETSCERDLLQRSVAINGSKCFYDRHVPHFQRKGRFLCSVAGVPFLEDP